MKANSPFKPATAHALPSIAALLAVTGIAVTLFFLTGSADALADDGKSGGSSQSESVDEESPDDESPDDDALDEDTLLARCSRLCEKEAQCEDHEPSGPDCETRCQADVKEGVCMPEWAEMLACYEEHVCGDQMGSCKAQQQAYFDCLQGEAQ